MNSSGCGLLDPHLFSFFPFPSCQKNTFQFLLGLGRVFDPTAGARASSRCVDGDERSIDRAALEVEVPTDLLEREKRTMEAPVSTQHSTSECIAHAIVSPRSVVFSLSLSLYRIQSITTAVKSWSKAARPCLECRCQD